MKYKLEVQDDRGFKNTLEFEADYIGDVVENFELFLRGSGFHQDSIRDYLHRDSE